MSLDNKLHLKSNFIESRLSILLFISVITFIKIYFLWTAPLNLFFDEAQYWFWSKTPSWGYYSKPPMVAWIIHLTTSMCGDTENCIRIGSPLAHLCTGYVIYEIARQLYTPKIAFYSALTYITLPAVFVSSFLISTDPLLLLFWALALLGFTKAIHSNQWRWWIFCAIAAGLGMLSKYNMLVFFFSSLGFLLCTPSYRHHLRNPRYWIAAFIALSLFLPNVIWNLNHHFVSFLHTKDNANLAGSLFHPLKMLEFIGQQFGVFGPVLFATLLYLLVKPKTAAHPLYGLPYWFVMPMLLLITCVALLSRAHANWAAPIYVAASIVVVAYLIHHHKLWLVKLSIILHISLAVIALSLPSFLSSIGFTVSNVRSDLKNKVIYDPFIQVKGWETLGNEVSLLQKDYPEVRLLVDTRKLYAELSYYVHPYPTTMVKWSTSQAIRDHFDLVAGMQTVALGESFLIVLDDLKISHLEQYFKQIKQVKAITIADQHPDNNQYEVYYAEGFKGF